MAVTYKLKLLEAGGKLELRGNCYRTPQSSKAERDRIIVAIEELRNELRFFREPKIVEVAERVSKTPDEVAPAIYALATETGWSEPDENTQIEAKDSINLAGWLNAEENHEISAELKPRSDEAKAQASKKTQQRAQNIRKYFPNLVPKIIETYLIWPDATRAVWYQIFKTEPPSPRLASSGKSFAFPEPKIATENKLDRILAHFQSR